MQKSHIQFITFLLLPLLLAVLVAVRPALAQDGPPTEEAAAQLFEASDMPIPPFIPGIVLVAMQGGEAAAASVPAWDGIEVLAVEPLDLRTTPLSAASSVEGNPEQSESAPTAMVGYKLTVPLGTEWDAIETLRARSDVAFAEPDWLAQIAQGTSGKASVETPFAITDNLYREQWYMQRIGISRAWSLAQEESSGQLNTVSVFVLDTGADFTHPDLSGKLAPGRNYLNGALSPQDDNGHGTHVSGLIAGALNGSGMVGPGLQVEITPFKVLNNVGLGGVSNIGQAIRDAADQGADVINMSLEISVDTFALRTATEYAVSQGVLIIAASGNQGKTVVSYPAAYPSVMAVGATSYFDSRTYYSNQGAALDIVAPGGLTANPILSSWTRGTGDPLVTPKCPGGLREVNGGLYCENNGTSMSTGLVSGAAALIMNLRPDLDADDVQEILLETAAPIIGTSNQVGRGRLDVAKAVRLAIEPHLLYTEQNLALSVTEGSHPFTVTLALNNPSLAPLGVEISPTMTTTWYSLVGPRTGAVRYGEPLNVQLVYTPSAVGNLASSLRVTTTTETGGKAIYFINTSLTVRPAVVINSHMYLAWLGTSRHTDHWAEPAFTERINYAISQDSSISLGLPFTMTVNERSYADLRVYADGFVVASASASPPNLPNHCLANQTWPSFAVYGWWSDLSLGNNSVLSTFQPDPDRFVIEYTNFVPAGMSGSNDLLSFQIVLSRNGDVQLNYAAVPEHLPGNLTIGASIEDGRFYNQITCHIAGSARIGEVPQVHQSFFLSKESFY